MYCKCDCVCVCMCFFYGKTLPVVVSAYIWECNDANVCMFLSSSQVKVCVFKWRWNYWCMCVGGLLDWSVTTLKPTTSVNVVAERFMCLFFCVWAEVKWWGEEWWMFYVLLGMCWCNFFWFPPLDVSNILSIFKRWYLCFWNHNTSNPRVALALSWFNFWMSHNWILHTLSFDNASWNQQN